MTTSVVTAEDRALAHFEDVTSEHEMTVLHDEGLYRHLRFRSPKTWAYGYDLVTWPGYLYVGGDTEDFVFSRIPDMFDFFGDYEHGINPHYWAQKLQGSPQRSAGGKMYTPESFRARVLAWAEDQVYGWLPRSDGRADFVLITFTRGWRGWLHWDTTTSAADPPDGFWGRLEVESGDHVDCERVAELFPGVDSAIRLDGEQRDTLHRFVLVSEEDPDQTEVCCQCGAQRNKDGPISERAFITGGWPSQVDCDLSAVGTEPEEAAESTPAPRGRFARWRRRCKLALRGECLWHGCEEPRSVAFDFCHQHADEDLRRHVQKHGRRRFDRNAEVVAEGIRRAQREGLQ